MPTAHFDAHWLAEAIRLREARDGRLDDDALPAHAFAAEPGFERRALARAAALAERLRWPEALAEWHRNARICLLGLLALATTSGAGLALAVLGDPGRPVNLVWALVGLLGMHLVSLALWLAGSVGHGAGGGGALGRFWLSLSARIPAARRTPDLIAALPRLLARNGLARWLFGMVSHGLWASLLLSALLSLLALFSVRRYGFIWETTILDADAVRAVVDALALLTRPLGFAPPDAGTLVGAIQADADRRAWAHWLVGCVAIYGLAPRLALWAWCRRRWRAASASLTIDLSLPDNLLLRERLMPDRAALGISDAAPAALVEPAAPRVRIDSASGSALLGIELGEGLGWPPALGKPLSLIERIETREDRRAALSAIASNPPRRLVVACDARLSPDRGTFALIAELVAHAERCLVWLMLPPGVDAGARLGHWREGLARMGFAADSVVSDSEAARLWLEAGNE